MDYAKFFDHTLLKPDATTSEIEKLCEEALTWNVAAACVQPCFLSLVAKNLARSSVLPISVVGFPLGATSTAVKIFETQWCLEHGAKEIDMVIQVGKAKAGEDSYVLDEIAKIKEACGPNVPLKVILETSFFTPMEISRLSALCKKTQADFVKTSTGFSSRGGSLEDLEAIKKGFELEHQYKNPKIKISGGVKTFLEAKSFIDRGVQRIGSSRTVSILRDAIA